MVCRNHWLTPEKGVHKFMSFLSLTHTPDSIKSSQGRRHEHNSVFVLVGALLAGTKKLGRMSVFPEQSFIKKLW